MTLAPKNSLAALFEGYSPLPPQSAFGSLAGIVAPPTILGSGMTQGAAQGLGLLGVSALFGHNQPPLQTLPYNWYYVTPRFTRLLSNLAVSDKHREAGLKKFNNIVGSLNRRYYDHNSETLNGIVIGSWGKNTQTAPPRDVDALFVLPDHVYHRFQERSGNRQSQLLQEVKDTLFATNSRTIMRADRHVVIVPFDAVTVEVAVGFRCTDGSIIVCDTKGDGRYAKSTALAEAADLDVHRQPQPHQTAPSSAWSNAGRTTATSL